ncbi:MAG: tRNA pseudouridine(38-40) synthase TruA [Ignavibacteria bacterium]|nr:tRNA pseudouridine(38-40) synthase TruA [Ignavibacteria bacterium]
MSFGEKEIINLMMIIEYDGINYSGWQKQKDKLTIQGTIENALKTLLPDEKINLTGAGRTDAGVSALNQCANFKVRRASYLKYKDFRYRLNSLLPSDIAVKKIKEVNLDFHARYSAVSRIYKYYFTLRKRALDSSRYFFIRNEFNLEKAEEFLELISGYHSFKSFCKNKVDRRDFMCNVFSAKIRKLKDNCIEFEITANRFLHSMVRSVAGAMLKIASGVLSLSEVKEKFLKQKPIGVQNLPPEPLMLYKINYENI